MDNDQAHTDLISIVELKNMKQPKEILKRFVEGKISDVELEKELSENNEVRKILKDDSLNWSDTYIKTNPFDYLTSFNIKSIDGRLNAQGAIRLFLDRIGVETIEFKKYADDYDLILDAQPSYIDADVEFIEKQILKVNRDQSRTALKKEIKQRFKEIFKFHKKPPKWIQSPAWPIRNDKPLFFIGQLEIKDCEYFHDNGAVYIFTDLDTGEDVSIKQFY